MDDVVTVERDLSRKIEIVRNKATKLVLVSGNFNILHPGHIRLLKFAKECGDRLVVAVNADKLINNPDYLAQEDRCEVVSSLEFVDFAFVNEFAISQLVDLVRPWAVVKGKEYENTYNPEKPSLDKIGGKLIFGSGTATYNTHSYLKSKPGQSEITLSKLNGYLKRNNIQRQKMLEIVDAIQTKRVAVIGDTIVDRYVQCNAVGMSQEDPTIVVTPDESKLFLGGAAIVAAHAKSIGAPKVRYFSVVGQDDNAEFAQQKLLEYGIDPEIYDDDTRPTILKSRYRVGAKTLLRVNELRSHDISASIQQQLIQDIGRVIDDTDVLIFSDFNYGMLPQTVVDKITVLAKKRGVILAADSQTSSQVGDISRFKGMDLITPTEREVRVALQNDKDGLIVLGQKLTALSGCKNLLITLAEEGVLLHKPTTPEIWENDRIKALAASVIDPAGAGDCLLASATLAFAAGANIWEAAFLGSIAAACQVGTVGNQPLEKARLHKAINSCWSF